MNTFYEDMTPDMVLALKGWISEWPGQPIRAIKALREATGMGLKEAKHAHDTVAAEMGDNRVPGLVKSPVDRDRVAAFFDRELRDVSAGAARAAVLREVRAALLGVWA